MFRVLQSETARWQPPPALFIGVGVVAIIALCYSEPTHPVHPDSYAIGFRFFPKVHPSLCVSVPLSTPMVAPSSHFVVGPSAVASRHLAPRSMPKLAQPPQGRTGQLRASRFTRRQGTARGATAWRQPRAAWKHAGASRCWQGAAGASQSLSKPWLCHVSDFRTKRSETTGQQLECCQRETQGSSHKLDSKESCM